MNFINKFTCSPSQLERMIAKLRSCNTPPIIDYVRENSQSDSSGRQYDNFMEIKNKIISHPGNHFAIKLSALGVATSEDKCATQLEVLLQCARQLNSTVLIDAENHAIQERINAITDYYMENFNKSKVTVYKTYQMYKKGANDLLLKDLQLAQNQNFALGVKLVRGAYMRQDRMLDVLCEYEQETHKQYDQAIQDFVSYHKKRDKMICATHNARSIYLTRHYINQYNLKNIEFAQLLGMCDWISHDLQSHGYKTYKYLPYGHFYESVPYLLRRLYENYPLIQYIQ